MGIFARGTGEKKEKAKKQDKDAVRHTHVNVFKVVEIVKAKRAHSKMAINFLLYLIFMALYVTILIMQRDAWNAEEIHGALQDYMSGAYRDEKTHEFKDHSNVRTVEDFVNYMEAFVIGSVYVDQKVNYEDLAAIDLNTVMRYNRVSSGLSLVQRRAPKYTCDADGAGGMTGFKPDCYGRTILEGLVGASTDPFMGKDGVTKYEFEKREVGLKGSGNYDVGYFQDLGVDGDTAEAKWNALKANGWFNEGTSWVRASFVAYNPNFGSYVAVVFKTGFDPAGEINMIMEISVMLASNYTTWIDYIRMILEIIFVILWFFNVIKLIYEAVVESRAKRSLFAYWDDGFNIITTLQLVSILIGTAVWGGLVADPTLSQIQVRAESITDLAGVQLEFSGILLLQRFYFLISGVSVLLAVLRIMGYLRVNRNLAMLSDTIAAMFSEFVQFGAVLVVLIVAFMLLGHIWFGHQMVEMSSVESSFAQVFDYLVGGLDFFRLNETDVVAAHLFFYIFIFVMIFIVLNITIAIIMDGYALMQERRAEMLDSHLREVANMSAIKQARNGLLRMLSPFKSFLPPSLRIIKCKNGAVLDRYAAPTKKEILALLTPVASEEHPITSFESLMRKLKDKQTTPERLESIFDRFDAWEDPDPDIPESQDNRNVDAITAIKQQLNIVLAESRRMESKVDMLLTHMAEVKEAGGLVAAC